MIREELSKGGSNIKQKIEAMANKQIAEMKNTEDDTYKEHKVNEEFIMEWIGKYPEEKVVRG